MRLNLVFLLVLGAIVASCRNDAPKKVELTKVTFGLQNNSVASTLLIAQGNDFFKKHGIEAYFKFYGSGKLAYEALFSGELDYATVADMPIASHGVDVNARIVSHFCTTTRGAWIVARTDRGISTPKDLSGKIIGTQSNSAVHYFLMKFIEANELTDYTVKFYSAKDLPAVLAAGEIDAFSMRNPFANQAKALLPGKTVEFYSDCYVQHFALTARTDGAASTDATSSDIIRALMDAESFINTHPDKAKAMVADMLPGDRLDEVNADWDKYKHRIAFSQNLINNLEHQAALRLKPGEDEISDFYTILNTSPMKTVAPERVNILGE